MSSTIQDQAKGSVHQPKGEARAVAWKAANDPEFETEGPLEKNMSQAKMKLGQVEKVPRG
jgi:uncharacterized protein YjbJ (UPF0337 family)